MWLVLASNKGGENLSRSKISDQSKARTCRVKNGRNWSCPGAASANKSMTRVTQTGVASAFAAPGIPAALLRSATGDNRGRQGRGPVVSARVIVNAPSFQGHRTTHFLVIRRFSNEEVSTRFYADRVDDRGRDHRYPGRDCDPGVSGLYGSYEGHRRAESCRIGKIAVSEGFQSDGAVGVTAAADAWSRPSRSMSPVS